MTDLPRGTVTLLFSDIEGSTRLLHALGERYVSGAVPTPRTRPSEPRQTWLSRPSMRTVGQARAQLGERERDQAFVEGRELTPDDLVAYAWEETGQHGRVRSDPDWRSTELQAASQPGGRLGIDPNRTASHVLRVISRSARGA